MIPFLGLSLWLLALAALVLILRPVLDLRSRRTLCLWLAAILLAIPFLFRPHEDIFGGQDPGAYLNSALSFARHGSLFHTDPLLTSVPPKVRSEFFYGHTAYAKTKDACLWVHNQDTALIGPWFQPAYSILMSTPAKLGLPVAVLYVAPVFTLFTALILAALASQWIQRPGAAIATFVLYLLNPVIAWNARCPRAESVSAFFLFAGIALVLNALRQAPWKQWPSLLLGLTCATASPLFHVTAWFPLLGLAAILTVLALRGRTDLLLAPAFCLLGISAFLAQSRYITDCYFLWPRVAPIFDHAAIAGSFLAAALAVTVAVSVFSAGRHSANRSGATPRALAIPLAVIPAALLVLLYCTRPEAGRIPLLTFLPASFFALTDAQGIVRLISPLAAVAAVAGWLILVLRRDTAQPQRLLLLGSIIPGLILGGWMNDYMMETRRLMLVTAPVMALCLAGLVTAPPIGQSIRPVLTAIGIAVLVAAMAWSRTHLYTVTEYRGLWNFTRPFADIILKERGMVLAEYSRIAAPFEHRFGIPLLALDSDRRTDYRKAEQAWLTLLTNNPATPAFFLTPYPDPVSSNVCFELVHSNMLRTVRLPPQQQAIPSKSRNFRLSLYLYRMYPAAGRPPLNPTTPFVRRFEGGNMGVSRFANRRSQPLSLNAVPLPANQPVKLTWRLPDTTNAAPLALSLFFHLPLEPRNATATVTAPTVQFSRDTTPVPAGWTPLADSWAVAYLNLPRGATSLVVRTASAAALNNVLVHTIDSALPLPLLTPAKEAVRAQETLNQRRARTWAEVLLPVKAGASRIYCFVKSDTNAPSAGYDFTINGMTNAIASTDGSWEWRCLDLITDTPGVRPLSLLATPPWNPKRAGFPSDLAIEFGYIVVAPAP